jgi:hypothetical protein
VRFPAAIFARFAEIDYARKAFFFTFEAGWPMERMSAAV